jgi:dTDP-4-amino-4,6-dideoxygalactose transaminase
MKSIPFNKPYLTGNEIPNIANALERAHLSGDGHYTARCSELLVAITGARRVLLTQSCTASLEMSALLAEVEPGDEVIMPSFTFVSTANAFVLRGATPVFVDIRPDTLNIDERLITQAITPRTKAIVPVHYAGVPCEMDEIMAIADRHGLVVIEDAAQALLSTKSGIHAGTFGALGTLSFHESKNIISGEGGALLINDEKLIERAEIIREKGTNRSRFFRGQVDKYTWVDVGSSHLPSEITAAFLLAQLERGDEITRRRVRIWDDYHSAFEELEKAGVAYRPVIPKSCRHNGHIYYLRLSEDRHRDSFIAKMRDRGIHCTFHYVPLHNSEAGRRFGRSSGGLPVTELASSTLVRLPIWPDLEGSHHGVIDAVIGTIHGK